MNDLNTSILDTIDPDLSDHLVSRRDALRKSGLWTGKLAWAAAASVPLGLAAISREASAQSAPPQVVIDVLNFALTLEYLEAEYYTLGVASGVIPGRDMGTFTTIRDHEQTHVAFLQSALGSAAVPKPTFDFTAGGAFDPFTNYGTFKALAQGFEDTGVRAYKGQLPALQPFDDVLTAAATIHSVEARHASKVRRLRGKEGWIPFAMTDVPALQPVYDGEDNLVQFDGINVASFQGAEAGTEAFDEPLTMAAVLAIAAPFIV